MKIKIYLILGILIVLIAAYLDYIFVGLNSFQDYVFLSSFEFLIFTTGVLTGKYMLGGKR